MFNKFKERIGLEGHQNKEREKALEKAREEVGLHFKKEIEPKLQGMCLSLDEKLFFMQQITKQVNTCACAFESAMSGCGIEKEFSLIVVRAGAVDLGEDGEHDVIQIEYKDINGFKQGNILVAPEGLKYIKLQRESATLSEIKKEMIMAEFGAGYFNAFLRTSGLYKLYRLLPESNSVMIHERDSCPTPPDTKLNTKH